jgi:hypothetical protein
LNGGTHCIALDIALHDELEAHMLVHEIEQQHVGWQELRFSPQ